MATTLTVKRLVPGSTLTNALATYYTCPASTQATIKKVTFVNNDTSPRTVTLHFVPSGGSADATNLIVKEATMFPSESWSPPDAAGHVLEAGGFIRAVCSANSAMNIVVSGVEIS
jgi:hypothetical protein